MTRNQYYIKGSRCVNHHTKKLCSVAKCKYIYLLYPEGILFSSLHWKATNEKCSIVGAIPYYLLNLCCIQEGFSSIQQHVCTRLTSTSKAMVSDPIYICHYYYTMENLFASLNDTRLVINHSLTVSEDKHFNLGVRGSVDSSILSSVDIKYMVKNICTERKYISWYYLLTFTSNKSRHFGTKVIQQWLEIFLGRIHLQNIKNCYIVIKINIHFIESIFFRVNVNIMGISFKAIYRLSHKQSNQSVQKCEGIFQKGI